MKLASADPSVGLATLLAHRHAWSEAATVGSIDVEPSHPCRKFCWLDDALGHLTTVALPISCSPRLPPSSAPTPLPPCGLHTLKAQSCLFALLPSTGHALLHVATWFVSLPLAVLLPYVTFPVMLSWCPSYSCGDCFLSQHALFPSLLFFPLVLSTIWGTHPLHICSLFVYSTRVEIFDDFAHCRIPVPGTW